METVDMAITADDITFFLSGGAANSDGDDALGGKVSATGVTSASLHNLFDKAAGFESAAGDIKCHCFYIFNDT